MNTNLVLISHTFVTKYRKLKFSVNFFREPPAAKIKFVSFDSKNVLDIIRFFFENSSNTRKGLEEAHSHGEIRRIVGAHQNLKDQKINGNPNLGSNVAYCFFIFI